MYADEGISRIKANNRKQFLRMIEDCKAGKIDRVITKSISRFARNTVDCLSYVRMLKDLPKPVAVYFEKEDLDTLDEQGELLLTLFSSLAQEESRNLSENIKWGLQKKFEQGVDCYPRKLVYGYTVEEQGNWVIVESEAEIVRRIFNEYLEGKSLRDIANGLTADRLINSNAKSTWYTEKVRFILGNENYCGQLIRGKRVVEDFVTKRGVHNHGQRPKYLIENHHPPIISIEQWETVQVEIKRRAKKIKDNRAAPQRHHRQELFRSFYCSHCGDLVVRKPTYLPDKTRIDYWRCHASAVKDVSVNCEEKSYREESMEHAFMSMLQEMKQGDRLVSEAREFIQRFMPDKVEEANIQTIQQEMGSLYQDLYQVVDAGSTEGEDADRVGALTSQIMTLREQVIRYNDTLEHATKLQADLDWLVKELDGIGPFNPDKQRIKFRADIFSRIVEKGPFYPDGIIVYDLCFGIQWTAKGNNSKAWKLKMKRLLGGFVLLLNPKNSS